MDYWPEVIQVLPAKEYNVYIYFDDGTIRLFDASDLVAKGAFAQLRHGNRFFDTCTVINHTLAWTPDYSYSEKTCLDVDPVQLYNLCPAVDEPMFLF